MAASGTSSTGGELILHRWPGAWGLPSLSPECVVLETYLRLAGLRFMCEDCETPYASPSGQLPALDQDAEMVGGTVSDGDDGVDLKRDPSTALYRIVEHLRRKVKDLDAHVVDRGSLAAYTALVEARLGKATEYFTWVDRDRFSRHTRDAYGRAFPAPLSYILPWLWRRQVAARMPGYDEQRIIAGVADAYAALAARLGDGGGKYFFGDAPSSLDAVAFAHLAFHAHSPVGDAMRAELKKQPVLVDYINDMQATLFPSASGVGGAGGALGTVDPAQWLEPPLSGGGGGGRRGWRGGAGKKKQRSAKEIRFRRRSRYAVLIAVGAVVSYLLFGEIVVVAFGDGEDGEDAPDDDDDDDE